MEDYLKVKYHSFKTGASVVLHRGSLEHLARGSRGGGDEWHLWLLDWHMEVQGIEGPVLSCVPLSGSIVFGTFLKVGRFRTFEYFYHSSGWISNK